MTLKYCLMYKTCTLISCDALQLSLNCWNSWYNLKSIHDNLISQEISWFVHSIYPL